MCSVSVISMNCLPDELLVHILSFLPTKEAVSTSILSKRWKVLFTFLPSLDFDYSTFWDYKKGKPYNHTIQKSFRDFVDRTLTLRNGTIIKKLSMKYNFHNENTAHVERWICNALELGVSPSKVLSSKTLVKLSIGSGSFFLNVHFAKMSLPSVKVLDIAKFEETDFSVFLAACPKLEELIIHHKCFPTKPDVISSKSIKRLSFTNTSLFYYFSTPKFISLDTPNVVDLYYSDYVRHEYPNCNLDSLAKATLNLHFTEDASKHDLDVTDLMRGIRNVKTLCLTSSAVKVISICCKGELPMFNNLVNLEFSSNQDQYWKVLLPILLDHSPNLKSLTLSGLDKLQGFFRFPPNNKVKKLRIMEYQGSAKELKQHIGHFLLKMKSLEMVRIYATDSSKKVQLVEDLSKLPITSSNLKIQVL